MKTDAIVTFCNKNKALNIDDFTNKKGKILKSELAKAIRSKIDIGYKEHTENSYISLVSEKLVNIFQNNGLDVDIEKLKPFVKRFILAKRFGDEGLLFSTRYSSPLSRAEVIKNLNEDGHKPVMLKITPTKLYKGCGWLADKVSQILKSKSPLIVTPVLAEILNSNIEISSYVNWCNKTERKNYLQYLLKSEELTEDPRKINFAKIQASGFITYYLKVKGRDNEHLKRHAYIKLCDEFLGTLPELYKDQILAKANYFELKRLCLRYVNPEVGASYYLKIINSDGIYSDATEKLSSLEKELTFHFNANTPIDEITNKYSVGRRGIENLKKLYLHGNIHKDGTLRLRTKGSKILPNEKIIEPCFDMLNIDELILMLEDCKSVTALTNRFKNIKTTFQDDPKLSKLKENLDIIFKKESFSKKELRLLVKDLLSNLDTLNGKEIKISMIRKNDKSKSLLILNDNSWNKIKKILQALKEELDERFSS